MAHRAVRRQTWYSRLPCYLGRWRVPLWLFRISPQWVHEAADRMDDRTCRWARDA